MIGSKVTLMEVVEGWILSSGGVASEGSATTSPSAMGLPRLVAECLADAS